MLIASPWVGLDTAGCTGCESCSCVTAVGFVADGPRLDACPSCYGDLANLVGFFADEMGESCSAELCNSWGVVDVEVVFDVADTSRLDKVTTDPINKWLRAFPTADETAPD